MSIMTGRTTLPLRSNVSATENEWENNAVRHQLSIALLVAGSAAISSAHAQTATFRLIPNALGANDMSPDGRWIVGTVDAGNCIPGGGYRYDALNDIMLMLPGPGYDAYAVSDDGTVILGAMPDPATDAEIAAIWRESTNEWESLGALPLAMQCPSLSTAYELSGDGSVAVGLSWEGCNGRGFRWTEANGMEELEVLANGSNRASVVSADGSVMAGFAQGSFDRTPAIWGASLNGELADPPNGNVVGEFFGISDDGSVLLGAATVEEGSNGRAVKWTSEGGFEVIGDGSVFSAWVGQAIDIADNGTIVGFDVFLTNRQAWIQPKGEGDLQQLRGYATGLGAEIPPGLQIEVAQAISTDGSRIIGHGFCSGGWIIDIQESPACAADLNGDGVVDGADLASLLAAWGSTNNPADLNGDGVVDGADLASLLSLWNATC